MIKNKYVLFHYVRIKVIFVSIFCYFLSILCIFFAFWLLYYYFGGYYFKIKLGISKQLCNLMEKSKYGQLRVSVEK